MQPETSFGTFNRLSAVMAHTTRYAITGQARLAKDIDVSRSTISRLIAGETRPSFDLILKITHQFEQELGRAIDPRELVSLTGSYPTPSICTLCGCRGCLPAEAYDRNDRRRPKYRHLQPGQWTSLQGNQIQSIDTADTS